MSITKKAYLASARRGWIEKRTRATLETIKWGLPTQDVQSVSWASSKTDAQTKYTAAIAYQGESLSIDNFIAETEYDFLQH